MKNKYLDLMEQTLSAYSDGDIARYFNEVQTDGLTEHGFPRLASNIGILISHGKRKDLLPIFVQMFDFCCRSIPKVKAANDFSVREVVCCLWEVEKSGIVPKETTERWRKLLKSIVPEDCYDKYAVAETDTVRNWALFSGVSEFFRQKAGLCDSTDFIEMQVVQQSQWMDENGMYRDNKSSVNRQPIMYDLVPRGLYCLLFDQGYRGKGYEKIDALLKKAALLTLKMQSPTGEIPFGGRSNGFLHNEAWMMGIYEYEAKRYAREGNLALAATFKSAIARAVKITEEWLAKKPIRHIKNRFPTESKFGCEKYAYFDKYMITVASNLYAAYLICDDTIPYREEEDLDPCAAETSKYFEKLFLKSGGYGIELDLDGDPQYDASGLGRIHRAGAPSAICLSCPCPSKPKYCVNLENPTALSLCSAVFHENQWLLAADGSASYTVLEKGTDGENAFATLKCSFDEGKAVTEHYTVGKNGVTILTEGTGEIAFALPAFAFDGENSPKIASAENSLSITYEGWTCRYTTNGTVMDGERLCANRNGHYRLFLAKGENALRIHVEITKE